jgi:hypothetical protein
MCGTGYPDTELKCPICGTESPITAELDQLNTVQKREYTPVKGGRFSQANVKKRLASKGTPIAPPPKTSKKASSRKNKQQSNTGLIIAVLLLLAAVIGVMLYIYFNFIAPSIGQFYDPDADHTAPPHGQSTPPAISQTQPKEIPCTGIQLSQSSIRFETAGVGLLLNVTCAPADTTDAITFISSDTAVATVTNEGMVKAVGTGTAEITVLCGTQTAVCTVVCDIPAETTAPTETVPETTQGVVFSLNRDDITFTKAGEAWLLYTGNIPLSSIQWSSDDESVATISGGRVKAVGAGKTTVYGEYEGIKIGCIIRCKFPAENG